MNKGCLGISNEKRCDILLTVINGTVSIPAPVPTTGLVPGQYLTTTYTVQNTAAAAVTLTFPTAECMNGMKIIVQFVDFSGATQTLSYVNTENSNVTAPTPSNGVLNSPLTSSWMFNGLTGLWRCVGYA